MASPEMGIWVVVKSIGSVVIYPLFGIIGYLYTKIIKKLETHDKAVSQIQGDIRVHTVEIENSRQDIANIDNKLDKILDRLPNRRKHDQD